MGLRWTIVRSGGARVSVVQPADLRNGDDPAARRWLDLTRKGSVPLEGQMAPGLVIVAQVIIENPSKVFLAEHDDVIKTLAA